VGAAAIDLGPLDLGVTNVTSLDVFSRPITPGTWLLVPIHVEVGSAGSGGAFDRAHAVRMRQAGDFTSLTPSHFESSFARLLDALGPPAPKPDRGRRAPTGRGAVLFREGDIFVQGGVDLVVLPASAKGTISNSARRRVEAYGLTPLPTPKPLGEIEVHPFPR
jgi:hypothetical protein